MKNTKWIAIEKFFSEIKRNGRFQRLGKLFHTKNHGYIYDLGTGKILQCEEQEYLILENIFENNGLENLKLLNMDTDLLVKKLEDLISVIEKENLLKAPPLTEFSSLHRDFDALKEQIENNLQQITLELTEKCNLRCKYCIYSDENTSFRDFDTNDMSWDVAKKAIDYGIKHSGNELAVTFYGGEPLIQFDLLKKCVAYTKDNAENKEVSFSMTSNLTLMTDEIANYIASCNCFTVVCSIDGPKEIHDENRLTIDGKGSFDKTIKGLKCLVEAFGDRAEKFLSLSMVMTLPATDSKLKKIQDFFDSLDWLPSGLEKNISYVSSSSHRLERLTNKKKEKNDETIGFVNPIGDWTEDNTVFEKNINYDKIFTHSFMQSEYLKIHKRMIVEEPVGYYNLNGCCIPASRRLYITAKGKFLLCEKIGSSPYIGDVENGLDFESIKKNYIDDYTNAAKELCKDCWAVRFCGNCYADSYDESGFKIEYKKDLCDSALFLTEQELISYHEMLERHPEQLRYLNNIVLK